MDFTDFYTTFASTLQYRASFEEYGRADFLTDFLVIVFIRANIGVNIEAIIDYYEKVFKD